MSQECLYSGDEQTIQKSLLPLACELAATPAVYQIVLELLQNEENAERKTSSSEEQYEFIDEVEASNPILNWTA